ncbi:MAG TPA: hypothetical protein VLY03_04620 [Bacteroidota bacterium]|nr:hypothetical protein [Bacteroidota bacterium]
MNLAITNMTSSTAKMTNTRYRKEYDMKWQGIIPYLLLRGRSVLLVCSIWGVAANSEPLSLKDKISMTLSSENSICVEGLNFGIDVTITNLTSSAIALPRRQNDLHMMAFDEHGIPIKSDPMSRHWNDLGTDTLIPGGQVTVTLEASFFDNDSQRKYGLLGGHLLRGDYIFQAQLQDAYSDSLLIHINSPSSSDDVVRNRLESDVIREHNMDKAVEAAKNLLSKYPESEYSPEIYEWLFIKFHSSYSSHHRQNDDLMSLCLECLGKQKNTIYSSVALSYYVTGLKDKMGIMGEPNIVEKRKLQSELLKLDKKYVTDRVTRFLNTYFHTRSFEVLGK